MQYGAIGSPMAPVSTAMAGLRAGPLPTPLPGRGQWRGQWPRCHQPRFRGFL